MKRTGIAHFKLVFAVALILYVLAPPVVSQEKGAVKEELKPLVEAYEIIVDRYYDPGVIDRDELVRGAIEGMLEQLPDEYNRLFTEEGYRDFRDRQEGEYVGIGIRLSVEEDRVEVLEAISGSPAYGAGIGAGYVLLKADGKPLSGLTQEEVTGRLEGDEGTSLTITVRSPEGEDRSVKLTRELIRIPAVEFREIPGKQVAVIEVNRFSSVTPWELQKRLGKLSQSDYTGYILDLRGNYGGTLRSAVSSAEKIVDTGVITKLTGQRGKEVYESRGNNTPNLPLVVLIDSRTASAAELLAVAIRDSGMGVLGGRNSFGKGFVQSIFRLTGEYRLKVTTAKYLSPNGEKIPEGGLSPSLKSPGKESDLKVAVDWIKEHAGELTPITEP